MIICVICHHLDEKNLAYNNVRLKPDTLLYMDRSLNHFFDDDCWQCIYIVYYERLASNVAIRFVWLSKYSQPINPFA